MLKTFSFSDDNTEKKFKVSAIIDWELAGFFPWWVERFRTRLPHSVWEILGDETDFHHPGHSEKDFNDIEKPVGDISITGMKEDFMVGISMDWPTQTVGIESHSVPANHTPKSIEIVL